MLFRRSSFFHSFHLFRRICSSNFSSNAKECPTEPLQVFNTFTKAKEVVTVNGKPVNVGSNSDFGADKWVKIYVCGPTVYDHCHLGHALTYVRFDLLTRVLTNYCALRPITAMCITDIDDKIIKKASYENKSINSLTDYYFSSFLEDLAELNIRTPNIFPRVTQHIDAITSFINRLRQLDFAYISPETGDVNFNSGKVGSFEIRSNEITEKSVGKKLPSDFALWKVSKPNEPQWLFKDEQTGVEILGRPGWHVECSVMSNCVFGSVVDFHYGGKDLIYPHHYCESACCHAYHQFDGPVYAWSKNWLHSGHLVYAQEKMSKSLGNVISIKDFLKTHTPNVLRLLCMRRHYRSDLLYDERCLEDAVAMNNKLEHFTGFLAKSRKELESNGTSGSFNENLALLNKTENEILSGISDDLDFNRGLEAVLDLISQVQRTDQLDLLSVLMIQDFLFRWTTSLGLCYETSASVNVFKEELIAEKLISFRSRVREISIQNLFALKSRDDSHNAVQSFKELLKECDSVRSDLKEYGRILIDDPVKSKK